MSGRKELGIKIAFVLFGIFLGLGALEVALEILRGRRSATEFEDIGDLRRAMLNDDAVTNGKPGNTPLRHIIYPQSDDKIIYDLRPDLDVKFQRVNVKTNSCGMRSPERPMVKSPNTYRIALLGDSFTFGWGVEQNLIFPQRLEDNLNRISGGAPQFEVLNFGVPGYSTFQEVFQFIEKGDSFQVDAIVVFFVQNDFGPPFFINNLKNPGTIVASSEIARLAMRALDPESDEKKMLDLGWDPNSSLQKLAEYASERGIKLFLTINPRETWQREWKKLWILRKRDDITFMDLRDAFLSVVQTEGIKSEDLTLSWDPHPSPLRHRIYGDIMTPYFMEAMR